MIFTVTQETIEKFEGGTIEALKLCYVHYKELSKCKKTIPNNVTTGGSNCACCKIYYPIDECRGEGACPLNLEDGCCDGLWALDLKNDNEGLILIRDLIYDIYLQALVQEYGLARALREVK